MSGTQTIKEWPLPEGELLRMSRWQELLMWVCAGEFLSLGALSVVISGLSLAGEGINTNMLGLFVGLAMLWVGISSARLPRSGLMVHQRGISVREPLRKGRQWLWSEVDRFELKRSRLKPALRVHLVDGQVVSAIGLEWRRARYGHIAEAWVEELNRRAASASESSGPLSLRLPSDIEMGVLMKLLSEGFPGRNALLAQLEDIRVEGIDAEGSLRLVPDRNAPAAVVENRVPVEAELLGADGIVIRLLLHVVNGVLHELEIYRDDLGPIKQELSPEGLRLVFPWERVEKLSLEESELLKGAVEKHALDQLHLLAVLGRRPLETEEREALRGALADEMIEAGLRPDDEPTEYGVKLDDLIGRLGDF